MSILVLATLGASAQSRSRDVVVREWIDRVETHQPGLADSALEALATTPPDVLKLIARVVHVADAPVFGTSATRNRILRLAAVAHMDVALLMPAAASRFTLPQETIVGGRVGSQSGELLYSEDGEYLLSGVESGHWVLARELLGSIEPAPARDPFVAQWYRAVVAHFEARFLLGNASLHLEAAAKVLPRDPVLAFYAGAMYDSFAGAASQSLARTAAAATRRIEFSDPRAHLVRAADLFRIAVAGNGPIEASVRLGRVLGCLGRHQDAAKILRDVEPRLDEPRLQYFAALFLGTEEGALGNVERARAAFARASRVSPAAQSPWLALSALLRRTGQRAAAIDALRQLQGLPADREQRIDPWTDYFRSYAMDGDEQLERLRASAREMRR